jgi:transcriptional regulator with XRE-family HTH domain
MSKASRTKVVRLAEKLLQIRLALGLSQSEMLERLGFADELFRSNISQYERGSRLPPLPVLLEYARAANVYVDELIDDRVNLPAKLPIAYSYKRLGRSGSAKIEK